MKWNFKGNKRDMPWKGERDPYKVWISEIILQQTRVDQGWVYYEKFIKKYPTVRALAGAHDEDVFKLWEGLGYYTRCKNLLETARFIVANYNGYFPKTYEEIIELKGIGTYTASAIASFCFKLPYAVVDGNVLRVLSRVFGSRIPIDVLQGKKFYADLAGKVLDKSNPDLFNQAIMDFGGTMCRPAMPACSDCFLNSICIAYKKGTVNSLPVKEKVLKKKIRWFSYFIFEAHGKILVHKRTKKDVWQNLFEFYLLERETDPSWTNKSVETFMRDQLKVHQFQIKLITYAKRQQLTHQQIRGYFIHVCLDNIPKVLNGNENQWLEDEAIEKLPFPGYINQNILQIKTRPALF